jgi:iron complex outermembrane receptor protein
LVSELGNPNLDAEKLVAYEIGYRIEPIKRLSFDLTGFYNVYKDLIDYAANPAQFEANPGPPHLLLSSTEQNNLSGETYGGEFSALWKVTDDWRLTGSYSLLRMRLRPDPSAEGDSPQQQFQIHSYLDLPGHLELNSALYYVDQISPQSGAVRVPVPSYFRLDVGVVWHPAKSLEIGVWGQNLLDNQHAEFTSLQSTLRTDIPRGVVGRVTWRF